MERKGAVLSDEALGTFGRRLHHARATLYGRTGRKLSQADIGRVFGKSGTAVGYWESDTNKPEDLETIRQLAAILNVSSGWLAFGEGAMTEKRELKPMSLDAAEALENNFRSAGPMRPSKPEAVGDIDYLCPFCKAVLVEQTNEKAIRAIKKIQCYACMRYSEGADLET